MSILGCCLTVCGVLKLHSAARNVTSCTVQVLYNSSQMQTGEMQAKLESQKHKRQQLEEEVCASQAHIAELTAILKSAVRSNSVSGPTGSQSPRAAALSREASGGEVGPRLRSKELQGEADCIHLLDHVCMVSVSASVHCVWHLCFLLAGE